MADTCCGASDIMLLACGGATNVGQIANDTAKALDQLGQGRMYCAVGVAAQFPSFVQAARKAPKRVAIDCCGVHCVRKALEAAGIPVDAHVVITDLGVEKAPHFDYSRDEVAKAAAAVRESLGVQG